MASFLLGKASSLVLLDFSEKMLETAKQRLVENHPDLKIDTITFVHGRVENLDDCLPRGFFDVILCHTLVEYVNNPRGVVTSLAQRLAQEGVLSLVVVNSFSEAFKLAIVKNDLAGARQALHKRDFHASLFEGVPKRTFSLETLEELVHGLNLEVSGRYGIRVFTDYLPDETISASANYRLLFDLEKEASKLLPYLNVSRYLHLICKSRTD
jgi:SAM-dependent methyltransferase